LEPLCSMTRLFANQLTME